jgi:hypothetical protein
MTRSISPTCENASTAHPFISLEMPWYVEHVVNNMYVLLLLAFVDHALLKPWITRRCGAGKSSDVTLARWFFIHSFANLLVCLTAVNSIRAVLDDPTHALDGSVYADHVRNTDTRTDIAWL